MFAPLSRQLYSQHRVLTPLSTQGCCFSRSSGPNSPYPGGAPNASARAINPPPLSLPESVQSGNQAAPPRRRRRDQGPLDQHINKPLRRHQWSSKDRRWTRPQLDSERTEFFDTRVTGRPEVWQTLHAALQVLWESSTPDSDSQESADGLATAQTIINAAEISLPTGNLAQGAYDSLGNYYQLPEWTVSDPENLVSIAGDAKGELSAAGEETAGEEEEDDHDDDAVEEDAERRREEKGKSVIDTRQQVTLRARLSENGRDIQVAAGESESVRTIAKRIADESGVCLVPPNLPLPK